MSQEKRNKILAITLVVFTLATICVMFFDGDANDKAIDKNIFRFSNLDEVDRIVLQSHKDTIVLSFNGSFWMVNDKYRADNNMIRVLFATLSQAEPRRAITGESQDSISLHLDSTATSVSVGVKENLSKQFDAGGNTSKTMAYFRDTNGEIYIMHIPGYRVYVSGIFELNESGFRDKLVFNFRWENFKGLKAVFPSDPKAGFDVAMVKDYFTIIQNPSTDTTKLYNFLDEVARLTVESYGKELPPEVIATPPIMELTVEDIASRKYTLALFAGKQTGVIPALVNGEPAYLSFDKVRSIIRPRSFFANKTQ